MKRTKQAIGAAIAAAWVACGISAAAQTAGSAAAAGQTLGAIETGNRYVNQEVTGSDNQPIGKIKNIVVDLESGRILYAVVGTAKGNVGLPPGVFAGGSGAERKLTVAKQKVEGAPAFTTAQNAPENLGQASYVSQVYQYFGQPAWWQGSAPANVGSFHIPHKVTNLPHSKVENVQNQLIGTVHEVVLELPQGRIVYVIFAPDPSLKLGDNLYALPPDAITLSADHKTLASNLTRDKLAAAPHFASNNWPKDLSTKGYAAQVYQYYGKQPYFQSGLQPTGR